MGDLTNWQVCIRATTLQLRPSNPIYLQLFASFLVTVSLAGIAYNHTMYLYTYMYVCRCVWVDCYMYCVLTLNST